MTFNLLYRVNLDWKNIVRNTLASVLANSAQWNGNIDEIFVRDEGSLVVQTSWATFSATADYLQATPQPADAYTITVDGLARQGCAPSITSTPSTVKLEGECFVVPRDLFCAHFPQTRTHIHTPAHLHMHTCTHTPT